MHPDDIQLEALGTATTHEQVRNQSPTRHITIRAQSDLLTEYAIDAAIETGLFTLTERTGKPMMLLQATPVIRNDGAVFVTVIAHPALFHEEKE